VTGDRYLKTNTAGTAFELAELVASGTITVPVPVAQGGTGGTTAAAARTALAVPPAASPTLTGTVTADNIRTSGSSGIQLQNSAGTAVLTAGSAATTNASFAGALNVGGKLNTVATASGAAGLNLPHGTAPSSPTNGDLWSTTTGFFGRVNGATVGPFGGGNIWDELATVSASASSSIPFTSVMDDAVYSAYRLVARNISPSTTMQINMRCSIDNNATSITTTSYFYRNTSIEFGTEVTANTTFMRLLESIGSGDEAGFDINFIVQKDTGNARCTLTLYGASCFSSSSRILSGWCNNIGSASLINAISVIPSTGTITTGEFILYGLRR
jgi:hypothetical protein